jgi:hypothetical protein
VTRICLVSGSFHPREGGAERQMKQVLAGVAPAAGHDTRVVTQVLEGRTRRENLDESGISIERVGSRLLFKHIPRLGMVSFLLAALVRVLSLRPDVLISLQFGAATVAANLAARILRADHVIRLTGGGTDQFRSEPFGRAASRLGSLTVRWCARYSRTIVVAPAEHLMQDLHEAFPGLRVRYRVITNGVPAVRGRVTEASDGVVFYARGGGNEGDAAMLALASACPDLRFLVMGRDLGTFANVTSVGWLTDPYDLLRRGRVLLNTSRSEGMPNTVLQAIALGLRVVGARNRGMAEVAQKYPEHVRLYEFGSLATAIEELRVAHRAPVLPPGRVTTDSEVQDEWQSILIGDER